MYATSVRAFKSSAIRMNSAAGKTGGAAQWFGYFAGITGVVLVGAGILYKANETNTIRDNFKKHGLHQPKA